MAAGLKRQFIWIIQFCWSDGQARHRARLTCTPPSPAAGARFGRRTPSRRPVTAADEFPEDLGDLLGGANTPGREPCRAACQEFSRRVRPIPRTSRMYISMNPGSQGSLSRRLNTSMILSSGPLVR